MKKKKYLTLYKKWIQQGFRLGNPNDASHKTGLCYMFQTYADGECDKDGTGFWEDEFFALMCPPKKTGISYWGGDLGEFTELRQNIVLFMCAMNGEL